MLHAIFSRLGKGMRELVGFVPGWKNQALLRRKMMPCLGLAIDRINRVALARLTIHLGRVDRGGLCV